MSFGHVAWVLKESTWVQPKLILQQVFSQVLRYIANLSQFSQLKSGARQSTLVDMDRRWHSLVMD